MAIIVSKKKDEPAEEEPEFKNWNISNSIEYRELMEAYNSCNKNYYDLDKENNKDKIQIYKPTNFH